MGRPHMLLVFADFKNGPKGTSSVAQCQKVISLRKNM